MRQWRRKLIMFKAPYTKQKTGNSAKRWGMWVHLDQNNKQHLVPTLVIGTFSCNEVKRRAAMHTETAACQAFPKNPKILAQ